MKKASFLVALIALLSLAGCSNSNNQNNSTNTSETTSSAQSQQGFKKNTLTNDEGSMTFTKVETTKTTNPSIQGEVKAALFIGKFTNKSKEELSPKDFWANYIRAYSVNKNSDSELMGSGLSINTPYDDLYQAGFDKVHPGKTVEFMIGFQNADLTKEYKIVPYSKSLDKLKPSLTIKAKNIDVSNLNTKEAIDSSYNSEDSSESTSESSTSDSLETYDTDTSFE